MQSCVKRSQLLYPRPRRASYICVLSVVIIKTDDDDDDDDVCLSVCLSRTSGLSREQRSRKTKIDRKVARSHVTRTPVLRSKVKGQLAGGCGNIVAASSRTSYYAALLLGGGRILRRTLSVCLSVCLSVRPSRYRCHR